MALGMLRQCQQAAHVSRPSLTTADASTGSWPLPRVVGVPLMPLLPPRLPLVGASAAGAAAGLVGSAAWPPGTRYCTISPSASSFAATSAWMSGSASAGACDAACAKRMWCPDAELQEDRHTFLATRSRHEQGCKVVWLCTLCHFACNLLTSVWDMRWQTPGKHLYMLLL